MSFFHKKENEKTGLALGGGGAKGVAHIAVLDELEQMGVAIDMLAGASIGALVGAVYCSGTLEAFKKSLMNMTWKKLLSLTDPVMPRSGLIAGKDIMKYLARFIPEDIRFEDFDIPFAVVATDHHSGDAVVFNSGNVLRAVRASISIPGIFVPVRYKDTVLIDGGIANPLPINVLEKMGAKKIIGVNLHSGVEQGRLKRIKKMADRKLTYQEITRQSSPESAHDPAAPKNWFKEIEATFQSGKQKTKDGNKPGENNSLPSVFDMVMQSLEIMQHISIMLMLRFHKPTVLIEPDVLEVAPLEFLKAVESYSAGKAAFDNVRREIKRKIL